jgi:gluconokinase
MHAVASRSCTLGIDLGTTAIKVAAFTLDANGEPIALASRHANLRRAADGAAELDPREQYASLLDALAEVVAATHALGYTVVCIGISAAMHSLLAVAADGAPLTAVMTWADLRAEAVAESLWNSPHGPAIYERTGTPIHAMSPLAKLLWLRSAHPDILHRAARFVGLKEWIWYQWFGEWIIDASLVSATGLYNLHQRQWDTEALALVGLTPDYFSRVVPPTCTRSGELPEALRAVGVEPGCAIVVGASDGALANLALHATDGRRLVVTIGTSLAVRIGASSIALDPATRTFCYVLDEERGLYVCGAASNSGGSILEWVYERGATAFIPTAELPSTSEISRLTFTEAMAAAGSVATDGLYFLPYIAGERAPLWTSNAAGALVGLRSEHTVLHALHAAAEGVMLNARWIAEPFMNASRPPEAVIASGGAFQNTWMRQLAADVFGLPVYELATLEASAYGAAVLADLAAGMRDWAAMSVESLPTNVTWPDETRRVNLARKRAVFQQIVHSLHFML